MRSKHRQFPRAFRVTRELRSESPNLFRIESAYGWFFFQLNGSFYRFSLDLGRFNISLEHTRDFVENKMARAEARKNALLAKKHN